MTVSEWVVVRGRAKDPPASAPLSAGAGVGARGRVLQTERGSMGSRWLDTGEWSREWKGGHLGPVTPCLHKRLAKVWDSSRRPQSMGWGAGRGGGESG